MGDDVAHRGMDPLHHARQGRRERVEELHRLQGLPGIRQQQFSAARTEFAGAGAEPAAVAGQSWGYTYDGIGNRSSMTRSAAAVRQADATLGPATSFTTSYTSNAVNQYAQIDPPQAIEVAGLTVPEVTR